MKKSNVALIPVFTLITLIFLVCSGCVSSDIISSESVSSDNASSDEDDGSAGESSGSEPNQGNTASYEKSSPYLYWEYELGDVAPENISEGRSNVQDCIKYTADGKYVAVGTGKNLTVLDVTGKNVLWKKNSQRKYLRPFFFKRREVPSCRREEH